MTHKPFIRQQNPWSRRLKQIQYSLFKKLTRHAMPVFVRGGDLISIQPMVWGEYEPEVVELIKYWADSNYSDFFLDIGANIGLISCQVGHLFKQLHLFEPNPDCLSLLKINLKSMLRNQETHLHPYALGSQKDRLTLMDISGLLTEAERDDVEHPNIISVVQPRGATVKGGTAVWSTGTMKKGACVDRTIQLVATRQGTVRALGTVRAANAGPAQDPTPLRVAAGVAGQSVVTG
jgi:hypothetical protein